MEAVINNEYYSLSTTEALFDESAIREFWITAEFDRQPAEELCKVGTSQYCTQPGLTDQVNPKDISSEAAAQVTVTEAATVNRQLRRLR